MIWPTGFTKFYQKETIQYRSDQCLHDRKLPYIAVKLVGGIIVDLSTTDVFRQVSKLLDIEKMEDDEQLVHYLEVKINAIKLKF